MQIKQRLNALTSLRFFAAAMIVFHHSLGLGLFGLTDPPGYISVWGQGVSFFFVLSGYILAYVYPKFDSWPQIRQFWRARIARVWPALAFSFLFAIWFLSLEWNSRTAIANLLMVNSWIPYPNYFYSYNAPSWSISTEFFFYLTFPFLIHRWGKTAMPKLLGAGLVVVTMVLVADLSRIPNSSHSDNDLTMQALLYISPLARLLEFTFGLFVASWWASSRQRVRWSEWRATAYEIAAIAAVIGSMLLMPVLTDVCYEIFGGNAIYIWMTGSGSMFASGVLIYVIAIGRGRISAWLSRPALVLLGEISFSLYLLHQVLLRFYHGNMIAFPHVPSLLSFTIFWMVLLLSSYVVWALVEMPLRKLILGRGKETIHGTRAMRESWHRHLNWNRNTGLATVALVSIVAAICISFDYSAATYFTRKHINISADSLTFYGSNGDMTMVRRLIEAGVDVNAKTSSGSTPLIDACWLGKQETALFLLNEHADINSESSARLTALAAAISRKHEALALMLLEKGANSNQVILDNSTALIEASYQGSLPIVKALLAKGADPNYTRSADGFTALKAAISNSRMDVVQTLIVGGAK